MPTVLRHERLGFIKVKGTYKPIGNGVLDWSIASNPKTTSKQYVHNKNASGGLTGYAPTVTISAEMFSGDGFIEYLNELGMSFDVGANAHTKLCIVDTWTGTNDTDKTAYEFDVVVSVDNPGSGPAGEALALSATLTIQGEGKTGKYNLNTNQFTTD